MYKYKFTVFTPTYNRAYIIENLYRDLVNQTYKDFEWLIVDDGSEDNTKELIESFMLERKINIRYIYKENGGKHTAMNKGVLNAYGEMFFTVDSDDGLKSDALEKAAACWNKYTDDERIKLKIAGISGLCIEKNGNIIGTKMPEDRCICRFSDLYLKYNVKGDKAIMFLTDVMKKYLFPERNDVKFIPENVILHEISKEYNVICINENMIIREYLNDGLTQNIMSVNMVKGRAVGYLYYINNNTYPLNKYPYMWIKNYINLVRYSLLAGTDYKKEIKGIGNKFMYRLMYPLGYMKYKEQKNSVR